MSDSFAELFENQIQNRIRPGSLITATVVEINQESVIVNSGLKSESTIPINQFHDDQGQLEVKEGDIVDVQLISLEDGYGETYLSRKAAKLKSAWSALEHAHKNNDIVTGIITDRIKGGFNVDVNSVRAFLPGSLTDIRPVRDPSYLEGKPLEFKVIKIDQKRNNVVVSRRAVVESENNNESAAILENLTEGALVKGVVKNLTDYGAFLDLGGIDGLLHITDMAWKRIKNPTEIISIGDEIKVKILKFDREKNRVSLGLKQMTENPWLGLIERYSKGARLSGKVTNLTEYGCFVELEEGIEGLVHVSEMDWTNKNVRPSKLVHVGQECEVVILNIDQERQRISLGMKQCKPNPWEEFSATYNKGDHIEGVIKSITDFGIFIELDNGIDGLVHLSDVSWLDNTEEALRNFNKGEEIKTAVLSVDSERERISLGIKQLEKDPFTSFIAENPKGSIVKGSVKLVEQKSVMIALCDGVDGTMKSSEISLGEDVDDARTVIKEGESIEVKITAIDRKKRAINLSVKEKNYDAEQAAIKEYASAPAENAKLGDLLTKN